MFAVIRVRGTMHIRKDIKDTLKMLRLNSPHHCIIVPDNRYYSGMIKKAKDYITWGTINRQTLMNLLKNRLKVVGNKSVDEKMLKEITKFNSFGDFSDSLLNGKVQIKDFKSLKPVFRLNPPKGGYKSIKLSFPKGDLGFRQEKINELLERMI